MGLQKVFAIIPARSGSKGVPKKNIELLGGYPLIAFSIVAAKLCSEIERVIVSTDSSEIAEIAGYYGAEVPFLRPPELAQDTSMDIDFIQHALGWLESHEGGQPDFLVQLRPTTPLRDPGLINTAIRSMSSHDAATSLRSVHGLPEPPQKMMGIRDGFLVGLFPDDMRPEYYNLPRQAFPPAYHPNGYVDIVKTSLVRGGNSLHGPRILAFITPVAVEVDRPEDFEYLRYLIEKWGHLLHKHLKANFPAYRAGRQEQTAKPGRGKKEVMSGYQFSHQAVEVPKAWTKFRQINTPFPVPESLPILEDLVRYEPRAMHGQLPVVWDRAEDFQVWDRFGNCWIDFTSTIFVANAGHANPSVRKAIQQMLDKNLLHSYTFATEIRAKYLRKLIEFTPAQFEKAFLLSSGTEATECAIKLMRLYGHAAEKQKGGIISFEDSMHGRTMGAQMLGGTAAQREWLGYEDPNIHRIPFPYPWVLHNGNGQFLAGQQKFQRDVEELRSQGVDFERDICGFFMESYIGWGAVFYPKDYIQALAEFARANDILVAFDEIQGGFGRTGKLFAYQHYEVEPDLICCGKGMSSSLPLSAVLGRASIMNLPDVGSMSSTHSANPLSCAAGLANIEVIELQNLVSESERKGEILFSRLGEVQRQFRERISYVLGKGLLAALILVDPATGQPDAEMASKICERAMQKGLLVVHTGRESIKLGPPLTIPDAAMLEGLDVLAECIEEIVTSKGA